MYASLKHMHLTFSRQTTILGLIACLLLTACTPRKPDPVSSPTPASSSHQSAKQSIDPAPNSAPAAQAVVTQKSERVERPNSSASTPAPKVDAPKVDAPPVSKTPLAKTASPTKPAQVAAAPMPSPASAKQPATVTPTNTPSTLDLTALEQRLRETRAIGAFTKLSLKNQVDDLLDDFHNLYRGKANTPLSSLRERYDLLMMKVLSLLQNSDAALAASIRSSREAIWNILKDPKQFSQIRSG
jgi:predicted component of type VI protein secretion system